MSLYSKLHPITPDRKPKPVKFPVTEREYIVNEFEAFLLLKSPQLTTFGEIFEEAYQEMVKAYCEHLLRNRKVEYLRKLASGIQVSTAGQAFVDDPSIWCAKCGVRTDHQYAHQLVVFDDLGDIDNDIGDKFDTRELVPLCDKHAGDLWRSMITGQKALLL